MSEFTEPNNTINVTIILKGHLMWYSCDKKKIYNLNLEKNSKIRNAIVRLGIPFEIIKLIIKDNEKIDINYTMCDGDKIEILPIVAGG